MERSWSVSSGCSLPPVDADRDGDSVCSDELMGSQSRRWLADVLDGRLLADEPDAAVGRDGLFVDYHFPVGELEMQPGIVWKRPKEFGVTPEFIVEGATRLDVCQGSLSDCWLLSAIASLAMHPPLLQKVVPPGQSFQTDYNGCFIFRFWQYGQWEEVQIDDLLPTDGQKLIYLSSPSKHEFWSALLEKAYAKLKGGYRALHMGFPHEAMADMTGGVTEVLKVALLPRDLAVFLRNLLQRGALINCANGQGPLEQANPLGIVFRHAYSLTAVEKVGTAYGPVDLVRILNPWGHTEWQGPWSDFQGPEWSSVSHEEQQRLGRVQKMDGEFWMSVSDFRQNFDVMEVCHLTLGLGRPGSVGEPWSCVMHHGNWVTGISAGGPTKEGLFWQNPQFEFNLLEKGRMSESSKKTCPFILALMQKHRRRETTLAMALHMYQAPPGRSFLSAEDLLVFPPVLCSPQYSPRREVLLHGSLPPGHYIIIPSTSEPNQQGAFLLRALTEAGDSAAPAPKPANQDTSSGIQGPSFPHQKALPPAQSIKHLFKKHSNQRGFCKPHHLHSMLRDALQGGVLAGTEKHLSLEHCKSLVALTDSQGSAQLSWQDFQSLWDKIRMWTDIFLVYDKNKTRRLEYQELSPALKAAGIAVNDLVIGLAGLRYTEPDMTISYPGFIYMLMKMESMIHKFHAYDFGGVGTITLNYRQWLQMTIYN